jgi:hypothetical protein
MSCDLIQHLLPQLEGYNQVEFGHKFELETREMNDVIRELDYELPYDFLSERGLVLD